MHISMEVKIENISIWEYILSVDLWEKVQQGYMRQKNYKMYILNSPKQFSPWRIHCKQSPPEALPLSRYHGKGAESSNQTTIRGILCLGMHADISELKWQTFLIFIFFYHLNMYILQESWQTKIYILQPPFALVNVSRGNAASFWTITYEQKQDMLLPIGVL